MEKVRAFIAIELDGAMRTGLDALQRRLKESVAFPVGWVRPEGIHLTLKFLGDVSDGDLDKIREALTRASTGSQPLHISLGELGGFPTLGRPRVLWVGLSGDVAALVELQRRVEAEVISVGLPAEERGFQPHLTLGRVRQQGSTKAVLDPDRLGTPPDVAELGQTVERVSLMRSGLRPAGAVYTRLAEFVLGRAASG